MKNNRRTVNTKYTVGELTLTLREWARQLNIDAHTLYRRFYRAKESGLSDKHAAHVAVMKN